MRRVVVGRWVGQVVGRRRVVVMGWWPALAVMPVPAALMVAPPPLPMPPALATALAIALATALAIALATALATAIVARGPHVTRPMGRRRRDVQIVGRLLVRPATCARVQGGNVRMSTHLPALPAILQTRRGHHWGLGTARRA